MKKLFLSFSVVFLYSIYSFFTQTSPGNGKAAMPAPTPTLSQNNNPQTPSPTPTPSNSGNGYKDGSYIGDTADAYYGNVQIKAVIQNGKITDVQFLQYPNDRRTSMMINMQAMPYLTSEAIQAQSASVDIVSGATDTSQAFIQSLQSALTWAK